MPYFVYKIMPPLQLTHIATLNQYQEARTQVRALRSAVDPGSEPGVEYRMIFAKQMGEAEKLLSIPKDNRVIGED